MSEYPFCLPPLPYPCTALCPYLDRRTLCFHHGKHFRAYVENLNIALLPFSSLHDKSLTWLLTHPENLPQEARTAILHNAGGVYNHSLYFAAMGPPCKSRPAGELLQAICRDFGSYEVWQKAMKESAMSQFGSGWAWLVSDPAGALSIVRTANQEVPPLNGCVPLLLTDVWEHAYYLQYQNRRADYLDAWLRLVNWRTAERLYPLQSARKGQT